MNKSFIILVVAVIVSGAGTTVLLMKKTADAARTESDKILNDFKAVDESLKQTKVPSVGMEYDSPRDSLLYELKLTKDSLQSIKHQIDSLNKSGGKLKF